ncbi:hypothetical protein PRIPAC_87727 [Pristionchus pacificus]|uniref:G protein-coupled receptor n=1 Tax=Pristionchus pacificus TaxID=54126 RepID=A0A2A6CXG1_PRIPA|nr:hypothetical protein PRIPAC_87727 [Pristionchus pacificus]|eukprot:PDM82790.1 G protein-coupled receptor [Pristionchus pacificus]
MRGSAGSVAVLYVYMHSAFGVICALLAVSNFGVSSLFFLWSALPVNLIFGEHVFGGMPGKIVGQISLFFLYGCEYSHIIISFNRLVSIAFPMTGQAFFTKRVTTVLVALILICAFLEITPYFKPDTCYFTYDFNTSLWNFADTECGHFCSLSIEKKLFAQSICQVIPLFCAILTYHLIGTTQTSEWGLFLSYTFSWGMLHAVDGIVLVAFHARPIDRLVRRLNKILPARHSMDNIGDQQPNSITLATIAPSEQASRQASVRIGLMKCQ